MSADPTRLEAGARHTLAWCASCPPWRRLAADKPEALREAATHVQQVHGQTQVAKRLRQQARRIEERRADTPR